MKGDIGYTFLKDGALVFLDDHVIVEGDCHDIMRKMNAESVDLIFADPPYFLSGKQTVRQGKAVVRQNGAWDACEDFDHMDAFNRVWIDDCIRILRKGGSLWISGTMHNIYSCGVILQTMPHVKIQNDVTWEKTNPPPNLGKRCLTHASERILWATKLGAKHTFNYAEAKAGPGRGKQLKDVWKIGPPKKSELVGHPTQKPEALLRRIILLTSKPGDLVVDPFSGSGTTVTVARLTGRHGIGIDSDPTWVKKSRKRIYGLGTVETRFPEHRKSLW